MSKPLLKVDPRRTDPAEEEFDRGYYLSLSTCERFRMIVERSILLLGMANRNAVDRETPPLSKRV